MFDALREYASLWRMFMNSIKTKVLIFNQARCTCPQASSFKFLYNNQPIEIIKEFKYLGVMLHAERKYSRSIEHRLQQSKLLVAAWMRRCEIWRFKPDIVSA